MGSSGLPGGPAPISLVGTASYLPEQVVGNDFFGGIAESAPTMFRGAKLRHHIAPGQTAADMIVRATGKLVDSLGINPRTDIDLVLTNVSLPDQPFLGCGPSVAKALGAQPKQVMDLHNAGCVSFVVMLEVARAMMTASDIRTALLCTAQTAAGRLGTGTENRRLPQTVTPGDGCGVGYVVADRSSPVRSVLTRVYPEYADDMAITCAEDRPWWDTRSRPLYVEFTAERMADTLARGRRIVPAAVREACAEAGITTADIDVLVTNQSSPALLRAWSAELGVPADRHVNTFAEHGNLFGAAHAIAIEHAVHTGTLRPGNRLVLGGFSHAGDYAAAAVIDWQKGALA
jgi:3-oxoacyl-[acyl-carrier-protein] synthase-3